MVIPTFLSLCPTVSIVLVILAGDCKQNKSFVELSISQVFCILFLLLCFFFPFTYFFILYILTPVSPPSTSLISLTPPLSSRSSVPLCLFKIFQCHLELEDSQTKAAQSNPIKGKESPNRQERKKQLHSYCQEFHRILS